LRNHNSVFEDTCLIMKLSNAFLASAFALAQVSHVFAHGDPETAAAIERRDTLVTETSNILARSCASKIKSRDEIARRNVRKEDFVNRYLMSRGLKPNFETKRESAATCVLAPEQELGPYCKFWRGQQRLYRLISSRSRWRTSPRGHPRGAAWSRFAAGCPSY
jgi:hypothetical protein